MSSEEQDLTSPNKLRHACGYYLAYCGHDTRAIQDYLGHKNIHHWIGARTQRRVEKELLNDFKKVSGKTGLLFQLAEASLEKPEG